jgi:hypothetical protein
MHETYALPKEILGKMKAIIDHHHKVTTKEKKC